MLELPRHRYAQTNIQLFNQAQEHGLSQDDLQRICRTYSFACRIFGCAFRPNGKPFVDHLVGTASILLELECRTEVICAALLHAAYTHGDFGTGTRGPTRAKRSIVRDEVGEVVEGLVARYTDFRWNTTTVTQLEADPGDTRWEPSVVLIRLANEFEELLDLGQHYCHKPEQVNLLRPPHLEGVLHIARLLGGDRFADELETWVTVLETRMVPDELVYGRSRSYQQPSPSYRVKLSTIATRLINLLRRRLRRSLAANGLWKRAG